MRRYTAIGVALAALVLVLLLPTRGGDAASALTPQAKASLAVVLFALILWATEALPFHITGLLSLVLLAVVGVGRFEDVVRLGFGSHIFAFMVGVMCVSPPSSTPRGWAVASCCSCSPGSLRHVLGW